MTNGATGALLVIMNALIGPADEVIFNSPPWFFYEGMILNSCGRPVAVNVDSTTFDLDLNGIERAITKNTLHHRLIRQTTPPVKSIHGTAGEARPSSG